MEAVAVVGVAAAALQFLDFGVRALVLCKQIRDKGSTEANQKLEHHTEEVQKIYNELQQDIALPAANRQTTRTRQECVSVGDELLSLLDNVKISSRSKNLAAVKATFHAMKGKREIEKIHNKLEDSQKRFLAAVGVETLNSVVRLMEEQGKSNEDIRNVLIPEARQGRAESSKNHLKTQEGVSELKRLSSTAHYKTQSQLRDIQQSQQASQKSTDSIQTTLSRNHLAIHKDITGLKTSSSFAHDTTHSYLRDIHQDQKSSQTATESMQTSLTNDIVKFGTGIGEQLSGAEVTAKRKEVMDGLKYSEMFDRQQTIKPPSIGTFEWIFDDSPPKEDSSQNECDRSRHDMRGRFSRWLRSDEPLFWISGKAGSGKSSLMAFIQDDPRTKAALTTWARGHELYTFSFYFWRPGSALQKSIPGLLRSLLYQLASAKPAIVDLIISVKSATYNDWTTKSLLAALQKSLTAFREDRVYLMIDGLDEYEDSYDELFDVILECHCQSCVKACLASRPETAILAKLESFPTLRLQDLNERDISKFVWDRLRPYEDALTEQLISQLICRAEGVFLWAALVVRSMISGCLAGDDVATLLSRLDTTPLQLVALFEQLLSSVEKLHQESLCLCLFHLNEVHWSRPTKLVGSLGLITASLPECQEVNSPDEFISACTRTSSRLVARWKGLVEIDDIASARVHKPLTEKLRAAHTWHDHRIVFVHRSAYDFFFSPGGNDFQSRIPWLVRDFDTEHMTRMTLNGLLVLLRQAPSIQSELVHQPRYTPNIAVCAGVAISAAEASGLELTEDFFEWLDDLRTKSGASFEDLLKLWEVVSRYLGEYTQSRWDKLMEGSRAHVICAALVEDLSGDAEYGESSPPFLVGLHKRLMEHLRKTHQRPTSTSLVHTRLILADDEGFRTPRLLSWSTSRDDDDEAVITRSLGGLSFNPRPKSNPMREALALMSDWGVYSGALYAPNVPMQLQVSGIPTRLQCPMTSNGPKLPSIRYRILCLSPGITVPLRSYQRRSDWKPDKIPIAGLLDLSTDSADRLSESWCFEYEAEGDEDTCPRFVGSRTNLNRCLEMLVEEIWDNEGRGLTAWQQLYMLACVKRWFRKYWQIDDSLPETSAGVEEEDDVASEKMPDSEDDGISQETSN